MDLVVTPLHRLSEKEKTMVESMRLLTSCVQNYFHGKLSGKNSISACNYKCKGSFSFYGRSPLDVYPELLAVRERLGGTPTFVDYGCGPGIIVEMAKQLGFTSTGIDIVPEYIEFARLGLGLKDNIIQGDILKPKTFKPMDVVYFWLPLADEKLEEKFEKMAIKSCKKILIHHGKWTSTLEGFRLINGEHNIFERC